MPPNPSLIALPKFAGKSGQLSFLEESKELPFDIKRVYWIYEVAEKSTRGEHAHLNSDRILICLHGSVEVSIENPKGEIFTFHLNEPWQALYFPRYHWGKFSFAQGSVLMALASCLYQDDQVETDYAKFKRLSSPIRP